MNGTHASLFAYRRSADQDRREPAYHPVVIVGAGPVGLVLALDLARKGHCVIVLERRTALSEGSRAICWSKRTLEIMDRLGLADDLIAKGVTWQTGRVFHREAQVFAFDLLPEDGHQRPAFINLQQYYFEHTCVRAAQEIGTIDIRWGHEVTALETKDDGVVLDLATPDGPYRLTCDWLVAADGVRSSVRQALGLAFAGHVFNDQFLICDIRMKMDRPTERWFWFDPPFNRGQSALLHRQADDVWRLDFQIGPDADREQEIDPSRVAQRVRAMLGDIDFSFDWISCYRFQCRRLDRFWHGRILFAGDAAHQVSPFGARGGNSGIQDADNLGWKLDLVLNGEASDRLLDSYDAERVQAADENILASSRSTDFITPKGPGATVLRDAVLDLAQTEPLARRFLNSGRLSLPTTYDGSDLNTADGFTDGDTPALRPGAPAADAPCGNDWLLGRLGNDFCAVLFTRERASADSRSVTPYGHLRFECVNDTLACRRYGADMEPALYLFRPDQHIAARFRSPDPVRVAHGLDRAMACN